jgi:hypothetical protein
MNAITKRLFRWYVQGFHKASGMCVNCGEYGDNDGNKGWTGYRFSNRDDIDDYETIEDWFEDSGNVTHYIYRDFQDGGSPDLVRAEFELFYTGHSGLVDIMVEEQSIIFLYQVINKPIESLKILEQISIYVGNNQYSLSNYK